MELLLSHSPDVEILSDLDMPHEIPGSVFFSRLLKSDRILLSIILIKAPVHNTNESEAALLEGKGWRKTPSSSREAREAALLLPVGPTRKSSHQGGERERRARKVKRPV